MISRILLCLALSGSLSAGAQAVLVPMSLDDLVRSSADIVQGTVVARESRWTADRSTIITDVTVAIDESWMGRASAGKSVVVRVEGGIVGDIGIMTEHQPAFGADERVLLFVQPQADSTLRCTFDTQGKFTVGERYVVGYDLQPLSKSEFRERVRGLVLREEDQR